MRKNLVNGFRKTGKIWWLESRSIICSSRWIMMSIFSLLILLIYMYDILDFADTYGYGLSPVVLPFMFADSSFSNLALIILIFLLSVFPIRDSMQWNMRMRSGNVCYAFAQLLTMLTVAFIWVLQLQLLSLIVVGHRCLFDRWGKIWGTCATGNAADFGFDININISTKIILYYKPYQAFFVCLLVVMLTCAILAEIIYLIDAITDRNIGELILAIWFISCFALSQFPIPAIKKFMKIVNASSWLNINDYMVNMSYFGRTLLQMGILLLIVGVADFLVIRNKIME